MSEDRVLRLPTGELISIIRTGQETEGEVFEFESVLPSGLSGPPAHWHRVERRHSKLSRAGCACGLGAPCAISDQENR